MTQRAEVAANVEIVRHAIDWLVEHDVRPRQRDCEKSLAVVESWLAGDADASALVEAESRARAVYERLSRRRGAFSRPHSAWTSACSAVAHLCRMAQAKKNWKLENADILQSCVYAIFNNDEKGRIETKKKLEKQLRARRRRALGGPPSKPGGKQRKKPSGGGRRGKREKAIPEVTPTEAPKGLRRLGRVIAERLQTLGAQVDPKLAGDETSLRALCKEHGVRVHSGLRDFDARYGGLVFPDADEWRWVVGTFANLSLGYRVWDGRPKLVPVVSGRDAVGYMDTKGAIWVQDEVTDPEPWYWAPNGDALIARTVLDDFCAEHRRSGREERLDGKHGARIAEALGLSTVRKANDASLRAWADARHVVMEGENPESGAFWTVVAGPVTVTLS